MLKKEALGQVGDNCLEKGGVDFLINKIYTDFENEICKNCKYHYEDGECTLFSLIGEGDNIKQIFSNEGAYIDAGFGCYSDIKFYTDEVFSCSSFEKKEKVIKKVDINLISETEKVKDIIWYLKGKVDNGDKDFNGSHIKALQHLITFVQKKLELNKEKE